MRILEIVDQYNPLKTWVIKVTKCRHYYANQKIAGRLFYAKFQRMGKKKLIEIGVLI